MSALFTALVEGETKESLALMVCEAREEIARLRPAAAAIRREALESHPVFAFLLGEGPLNGLWFGDAFQNTDGGRPKPYWWRTYLREAIRALQEPGKP